MIFVSMVSEQIRKNPIYLEGGRKFVVGDWGYWVQNSQGFAAQCVLHRKEFLLERGGGTAPTEASQFVRKKDPDHYIYIETGSKNRSGGLKEINLENKVVPIYASPAAGERCLVHLLDLYLQKLPALAFERDVFYWQPKARVPDSSTEPWYGCQPVEKHKLNTMVATMCAEAGISERKTNHSLRVSGATSLYSGGVPEREIQ